MAKNFGKFLLGAAVIGAAIAGGYAYLNKCKCTEESWNDDFDDFEDEFEEDLDAEADPSTPAREYVTIPKEPHIEEASSSDEATASQEEEVTK